MGWGLFFLGYLASMGVFHMAMLIPSALLTGWALWKLSFVNRHLSRAKWYTPILLLIGVVTLVISLTGAEGESAATLISYMGLLSKLVLLAFLFTVLVGIQRIAEELDLQGLRIRAFRNRIFLFLFYVPGAVLELNLGGDSVIWAALSLVVSLVGLVVFVLNALLYFDCYRLICMPDDLEMKQTPSRFSFINHIREQRDQREQEALEQAAALRAAKRARRAHKQKKG